MSAAPVAPTTAARRAGFDRALVAPRLRPAAWCVVAGLGLLVGIGGVVVHGDRAPLDLEVRAQDAIDARIGDPAMWSDVFGTVIPRVGLVVLLALVTWMLTQRRWRGVAACAAAPIAVAIAEHALKPLVDRMDPGDPEFFYPSGHLTGVGAIAILVLVLVLPRLAHRQARLAFVLICAIAVGLALFATVAGHGHGPLDAAAGLPTGAGIALAWVLLVDAAFDAVSSTEAGRTAP